MLDRNPVSLLTITRWLVKRVLEEPNAALTLSNETDGKLQAFSPLSGVMFQVEFKKNENSPFARSIQAIRPFSRPASSSPSSSELKTGVMCGRWNRLFLTFFPAVCFHRFHRRLMAVAQRHLWQHSPHSFGCAPNTGIPQRLRRISAECWGISECGCQRPWTGEPALRRHSLVIAAQLRNTVVLLFTFYPDMLRLCVVSPFSIPSLLSRSFASDL